MKSPESSVIVKVRSRGINSENNRAEYTTLKLLS
nr:MAG TPA: hypothetical protein [Caudoviricetes sp.]